MKQGNGIPVFSGIAIGSTVVYRKKYPVKSIVCDNPGKEQEKFNYARKAARQQLQELYNSALENLGEDHAAIIEVQMMLLEDLDYLESVEISIASGTAAVTAALDCGEKFAQIFAAMDDEYMRARSADIRDVSRRIYNILSDNQGFTIPDGNFLLVAEDLAPSETIQLPRERILGFITQKGSSYSHTAILARSLNIPSLVQCDIDLDDADHCTTLAIDGFSGKWYMDPDAETIDMLLDKQKNHDNNHSTSENYRGKKSISKSGKKILLCANIGCPEDAQVAVDADCEGIGLMRSEFLYLGRDTLPSEDELFEAYKNVALVMGQRPVVIRTIDIGADKQADYMDLEQEDNPALGFRGLRICLAREKEIFRPQLRAIYRASMFGNLRMMFPMVASVWEFKQAKDLCHTVYKELCEEGFSVREIPIGIMIETPAAAVLAPEFAKQADFFSVGTNDLTQYTLAIDRQNAKLDKFYDAHHPAVLALLGYIAKSANDAGIRVGICGELGSDPELTEVFIKMGYTELSMAPSRVLEIRKLVCESEV